MRQSCVACGSRPAVLAIDAVLGEQRHAGHRLAQQAAAIAAQIDHHQGWRRPGDQAGLDRLAEALGGVAVERGDAQDQQAAVARDRDRLGRHVGERHRHVADLVVGAADAHVHFAAFLAGQQRLDAFGREPLHETAVHGQDAVADAKTGILARAAGHHVRDRDEAMVAHE